MENDNFYFIAYSMQARASPCPKGRIPRAPGVDAVPEQHHGNDEGDREEVSQQLPPGDEAPGLHALHGDEDNPRGDGGEEDQDDEKEQRLQALAGLLDPAGGRGRLDDDGRGELLRARVEVPEVEREDGQERDARDEEEGRERLRLATGDLRHRASIFRVV